MANIGRAPGGDWYRNEFGEWERVKERLDEDAGEVTAIPTPVLPGHRG